MAEAGGHLWISQADSDWTAAGRVFQPDEPRTYCQAISKYQQVVEKSVKAVAASLRDRFISSMPIGYNHEVAKIASGLRRAGRPNDPFDIQSRVNRLFADHVVREVKVLDALAPRKPALGALHGRNTEYPYETIAGLWTVPALSGAFDRGDVKRFQDLATEVFTGAKQIVSALRR